MANAESPTSRQEQHLDRVDFLVRKFTALAEDREKASLLRDPLPHVDVVELKSSGFLWPGSA
jgi:hypothetical protein